MKTLLHKSEERGHANHGWLDAKHSFSFASWFDPEKVHFGALRVLNDDTIAEGMGFGEHPHDNMEIVTIPFGGRIEHKDSMGNGEVLAAGEVQLMSAGTGIRHSEFNPDDDQVTRLFQIWVFPKEKGIEPDYGQKEFSESDRQGNWQVLVAPDGDNSQGSAGPLKIHQDAWFSRIDLNSGEEATYTLNKPGSGVYLMVIEGSVNVHGQDLGKRDALGISETSDFKIETTSDAQLLAIEVPM